MNAKEREITIKKRRIMLDFSLTTEYLLGGMVCYIFFLLPLDYFINKYFYFENHFYLISTLILICIIPKMWFNNNIEEISTNLNKADNIELIKNLFNELNWEYEINYPKQKITEIISLKNISEITVFITNEKIYLNIRSKYLSGITRAPGRLTYTLGFNSFKKIKLKSILKQQLKTTTYNTV